MNIVAMYSFNGGKEFIEKHHKNELKEVIDVISLVDAKRCKTKISKEKTMPGKSLYSPVALNTEFKRLFYERGWNSKRIVMVTEIPEIKKTHRGFREMDAIKNKLGVEVQFGKYSFMVYNVSAKMTIFSKNSIIDSGIEIVPMRSLSRDMSTGVSFFEQMKADLEQRGISNIDISVLIIGISQ
ncbi:MAG: restriction endonuclease [Candidatus Aenigmarchaeota archaeon]|nr:restriction endonuclease [Candidatus Aenigmarchaeota archaeon]